MTKNELARNVDGAEVQETWSRLEQRPHLAVPML